jgi:hypothetical protein
MIYTNPIYGFFNTLRLFITGKVRFIEQDVGKTIIMDDGQDFTVFRRVVIKGNVNKRPGGLFIVRFTPKMDIQKNIKLSRLMLMIFMGFKGFRSKYWCVNEKSGMCQGVYEWDTLEDAERYSKSIAITNMTQRSVPGSVTFKVLPNTEANRTWRFVDTAQDEKRQFKLKYHLA